MIYRLIVLNGDRKGQQITVPAEPLTLGRQPESGLCLNDPEIASAHAVVQHTPHGLVIHDLGSMGKILVNNHEVRRANLVHGDVIELGLTRLLVQAVVEAEVRIPGRPPRTASQRGPQRTVLLVLLILAIGITVVLRLREYAHRAEPRDWSRPLSAGKLRDDLPEVQAALAARDELPPSLPEPDATPPEAQAPGAPSAPHDTAPAEAPPTPTADAALAAADAERQPPLQPPTPPAATPDPYVLAREMMAAKVQGRMLEAQLLIASNRLEEADALLSGIQQIAPEHAPAYAERAWLFEDRGMLQPALDQWRSVIRLGSDSDLIASARHKVESLTRAQSERVPRFSNQVRILSTEQRKFPESRDTAEMRLLTIRLEAPDSAQPLDPRALRVEVRFFDRDPQSNNVRPSRVAASLDKTANAPWPPGTVKTLTATYVVPADPTAVGPRSQQYYGHVVRVYYYGALQDEYAQPQGLLAGPPDGTPADPQTALRSHENTTAYHRAAP
jgi:pSer/pThr/pTyr-binding forkhead associated (FHA) protein